MGELRGEDRRANLRRGCYGVSREGGLVPNLAPANDLPGRIGWRGRIGGGRDELEDKGLLVRGDESGRAAVAHLKVDGADPQLDHRPTRGIGEIGFSQESRGQLQGHIADRKRFRHRADAAYLACLIEIQVFDTPGIALIDRLTLVIVVVYLLHLGAVAVLISGLVGSHDVEWV